MKRAKDKYMINRTKYKDIKRYDHKQMEDFLTDVYKNGYADGKESVPGVELQDVEKALQDVKGIGPVVWNRIKERLAELLQEKRTVIFYEAPHKLRTTLDDLTAAFGADRSITLCRELTKLHEEIWKTTLGEAVEHYRAAEPRGEYVLVMAGAPAGAAEEEELTLEQAAQRAFALTIEGFSASAAAKTAAQGTAYSKSEVYKQLLLLQQATE